MQTLNLSNFEKSNRAFIHSGTRPRIVNATERFSTKPIFQGAVDDLTDKELERFYIGTVEIQQGKETKIFAGSDAVITEVYQNYLNDPKTTDIIFR